MQGSDVFFFHFADALASKGRLDDLLNHAAIISDRERPLVHLRPFGQIAIAELLDSGDCLLLSFGSLGLALLLRRVSTGRDLAGLTRRDLPRLLGRDRAMDADLHLYLPPSAGAGVDEIGPAPFARDPQAEAGQATIPDDTLTGGRRLDRLDRPLCESDSLISHLDRCQSW